jgi:hypothetical protein
LKKSKSFTASVSLGVKVNTATAALLRVPRPALTLLKRRVVESAALTLTATNANGSGTASASLKTLSTRK